MTAELCIFFLLGSAFGVACMMSFQEAKRLRRRMILRKLAQRGWELE